MKLTYRGVKYDYNPPTVETVERGVGGKYRGLDWRFRNLKKPPVLQPAADLKYRGVHYQIPGVVVNNKLEQEKVPALLSTADKARVLMLGNQRSRKNRQLAMLNRSAEEVGLTPAH
ncbi:MULTISPECIES: DUF4278 domain-containing protein [unclassified Coleofasciculus]|uniref:DUF4278 domain-containing protein n=1 Tax=unclassified Coleofasciculus TaxID=2692782 RepID=UPI0018800930|nr:MULTISPECIES: DUF4278 domain-containing protein [unclassified Coleofasciculus]MBE9128991.1 DUF4278 domain-containing protein [Coleofasciculus sp. LEGE 07081]MBE9151722.1 DUF4278 domain-containing protein [Coleofasciculus sp. LEGE 07092]